MNTELLIQELISDCSPVKTLLPPLKRFFVWVFITLLWISFGVFVLAVPENLFKNLTNLTHLLQIGYMSILACITAAIAFYLSVPRKQSFFPSFFLFLIIFLLPLSQLLTIGEAHVLGTGTKCLQNIFALSLPPGILFLIMLKKSFILKNKIGGIAALVATSTFASAGTRLICPNEASLHFLIWHILVILVFAILGWLVGKWLLPLKGTN